MCVCVFAYGTVGFIHLSGICFVEFLPLFFCSVFIKFPDAKVTKLTNKYTS